MARIILYVVAGLIVLVPVLVRAGLRVQPKPLPSFPQSTPEMEMLPLPAENLPTPVSRYYRAIAGDRIPVINSAVISTRGTLRFAGITFPTRFRFTHDAGQGYRHYAEVMLFGLPLLRINERFLDGQARMELPAGIIENEPKVDMAANLGLWGESLWLPSIYLTDPRVEWQPVDDTTARLVVPHADGQDSFTVFFDPATGLIERMEAMRYKDPDDAQKTLWINEARGWKEFHGLRVPSPAAVTWADEGTPWLVVDLDEVIYNADIDRYIRAKGP